MIDAFDDDPGPYYPQEPRDTPRIPLVSIEAEAALLGAIMLDNKLMHGFAGWLKVEHFFEPLHQRIYDVIQTFFERGKEANPITLRVVFMRDVFKTADGGEINAAAYLPMLTGSGASLIGARDFAEQVIELARRRAMRDSFRAAADQLDADALLDADEVRDQVESTLWETETAARSKPRNMGQMAENVADRHYRLETGDLVAGVGNRLIPDLDTMVGTLEPGYIILAGRPGMGKSIIGCSLSIGYSAAGANGLYLHGEMTEEQMDMRATSDLSYALGMPLAHSDLRQNKLGSVERNNLARVGERAKLLPLQFEATGEITISQVRAKVKREKARLAALGQKLHFVTLDYIGLYKAIVNGREETDDRRRVNAISSAIKTMAKEEEICMFVLAQLGRGLESRADKRPVMSDLKESGNLEQDADVILLLYREEYYLQMQEPKLGEKDAKGNLLREQWETDMMACEGKLDLICGKNRHGSRRTRTLRFVDKYVAVRGSKHNSYMDDDEPLLV